MKKTIKCGIVAAVAVAAGFAAYQSYGSYGAQDNSLLMQNVEALAADDNKKEPRDGDPSGEIDYVRVDDCFLRTATRGIPSIVCPSGSIYPNLKPCPKETQTVRKDDQYTGNCVTIFYKKK